VQNKPNSANGFYYLYDGTFLGNYGTSNVVVVCDKMKTIPKSKTNKIDYDMFYNPVRLKMTNQELNLRAFMATIKQTENSWNAALPYNAKHGFKDGKLNIMPSIHIKTVRDHHLPVPIK
jgi:hypothetical protein